MNNSIIGLCALPRAFPPATTVELKVDGQNFEVRPQDAQEVIRKLSENGHHNVVATTRLRPQMPRTGDTNSNPVDIYNSTAADIAGHSIDIPA